MQRLKGLDGKELKTVFAAEPIDELPRISWRSSTTEPGSTFLAAMLEVGIEVLCMVDPVDEFSVQRLKGVRRQGVRVDPRCGAERRVSRAAVEGVRRRGAESTFLEALLKKGTEVLCRVDPVDGLAVRRLEEFEEIGCLKFAMADWATFLATVRPEGH